MTLKDLALRLTRKRFKLAEDLSKTSASVAELLVEELVSTTPVGTPVDTSKALSNWQVTLDNPDAHEIDAHVKGSKKSTYAQSATTVRVLAAQILKTKKKGQTIYVSNTAPYIRELNYEGSSRQSPKFFIQEAIATIKLHIPLIYRGVANGRRKN